MNLLPKKSVTLINKIIPPELKSERPRLATSGSILLKHGYQLATFIGQPTFSTNGNINTLTLSDDYTISFIGMRLLKHNGSQLHGIGFLPDVYVERTIEGVKAGRNEFLEKAIEIAKQ